MIVMMEKIGVTRKNVDLSYAKKSKKKKKKKKKIVYNVSLEVTF